MVTSRNHDGDALRKLDVAHHLPAQSSYRLQRDLGGSRIITRAEGSTIWDADGNALLDGMAGLWCVDVGYGREELAEVAYRQMLELPFYNTFFRTATPPPIELAAKLAGLLGGELQHIFFNNSGSESNDTVFRLVRTYWDLKGEPDRKIFISRTNAYHGSTVASASLGGMSAMHAQGGLPIPGVEHVMQPYAFGESNHGETEDTFAARAAQAIEDRILAVGPENVAAFIGEPVQGAGGVVIPPAGYWPRVEAICRRHGILLVSDEVICGFGRLGEWFGFQHFGYAPDIVSMAKGLSSGYLPISATAVSREIVETLRSSDGDFVHGYTYSGHPVAAAVALRNVEILEREDLVCRVREDLAPFLATQIARLDGHPLVGEVRSLGLLAAVEIVADKHEKRRFDPSGVTGPLVRDACIARGLMVRAVRDTIVMCPPFVVTHDEITRIVDIIAAALDDVASQLELAKGASVNTAAAVELEHSEKGATHG